MIHKHNLSRSRITSVRSKDKTALFPRVLSSGRTGCISALCTRRPSAVHGLVLSSSPRIINVFHASLVAVPIFLHSNYAVDALRGTMHKRLTQEIN